MKINECKAGVRVKWAGNDDFDGDSGVIVEQNGSVFPAIGDRVWVKWDSNGDIQYIRRASLVEVNQNLTEEQAVMLLLSKGYTITKG